MRPGQNLTDPRAWRKNVVVCKLFRRKAQKRLYTYTLARKNFSACALTHLRENTFLPKKRRRELLLGKGQRKNKKKKEQYGTNEVRIPSSLAVLREVYPPRGSTRSAPGGVPPPLKHAGRSKDPPFHCTPSRREEGAARSPAPWLPRRGLGDWLRFPCSAHWHPKGVPREPVSRSHEI